VGRGKAERIKVLPEDWQDILRLRYSERLVELRQHQGKPQHDADGVIWEEDGERPATAADRIDHTPSPNGVPAFLSREAGQVADITFIG
jgi:hypothetical protein